MVFASSFFFWGRPAYLNFRWAFLPLLCDIYTAYIVIYRMIYSLNCCYAHVYLLYLLFVWVTWINDHSKRTLSYWQITSMWETIFNCSHQMICWKSRALRTFHWSIFTFCLENQLGWKSFYADKFRLRRTIYTEKPSKLNRLGVYAYQGNQNISRKWFPVKYIWYKGWLQLYD